MYYRRKILLSLLQTYGGKLSKIDFQKYLFLLNVKRKDPFFEFIPYKYGCYSFQANQDMKTLTKYNLVEENEMYWSLARKVDYLTDIQLSDRISITKLYDEFKQVKGNELIKYIYEKFPYYAINSVIAQKILNGERYKLVTDVKRQENDYALFSIGYQGKTVEGFANELINENVHILCDIRKNALSMKYGFSKKLLKLILENVGIKYIHLPELGIASNKRQNLHSKEDYEDLFRDYEQNTLQGKSEELGRLYKIFKENKRIALMCFEADFNCCHRSRTVNAIVKLIKEEFILKHL